MKDGPDLSDPASSVRAARAGLRRGRARPGKIRSKENVEREAKSGYSPLKAQKRNGP